MATFDVLSQFLLEVKYFLANVNIIGKGAHFAVFTVFTWSLRRMRR